jgi:hypothetical protein
VRVFLKPPGWQPLELGGPERPKEKDKATFRKFDTQVPGAVTTHVVVQFILLLAVTTFFLFRQNDLGPWRTWTVAGLIILWVMDMGLLLEGQGWAAWVEIVRILLLGVVVLASGDLLPTPWPPILAVALTLGSLIGTWWSRRALEPVPIRTGAAAAAE